MTHNLLYAKRSGFAVQYANKYNIIIRLWTHAFHKLLESPLFLLYLPSLYQYFLQFTLSILIGSPVCHPHQIHRAEDGGRIQGGFEVVSNPSGLRTVTWYLSAMVVMLTRLYLDL